MSKILLIEDDIFLQTLYLDLLTAEKYEVTAVSDGEQALQKILEGNWDLILLDVILPKLNAIRIIEEIKKQDPNKLKQNIVYLTNMDQSDIMDKLKKTGYNYLTKSKMNPDEFISQIKKYLPNL
ncbi:MAG: response regulator [bacterium]|nr:response regulator [bacterium]